MSSENIVVQIQWTIESISTRNWPTSPKLNGFARKLTKKTQIWCATAKTR